MDQDSVTPFLPTIRSAARAFIRNLPDLELEDLEQQGVLAVLQFLSRQPETPLTEALVYTICKRDFLDMVKLYRRRPEYTAVSIDAPIASEEDESLTVADVLPDSNPTPEQVAMTEELEVKALSKLRRLPTTMCEVLNRFFGIGCEPSSLRAISKALSISDYAAKANFHRGISLLAGGLA